MSHDRDRAARLVAWSYRQVASGNTRLEAFLEEAIAALEMPVIKLRPASYFSRIHNPCP